MSAAVGNFRIGPRIAIDGMGGDYAPYEITKGAILASLNLNCEIILVGDQEKIFTEIDKRISQEIKIKASYTKISENESEIEIQQAGLSKKILFIDAREEIPMDEKNPAKAVRRAQNSSIVVANKLVASGRADAVIAAGHTGAATAASLFEIKRIDGFERPCICTMIPTIDSNMLLIDGGSNIESSPEQMLQSAIIGSLFCKLLFKIEKPRIGLLNVGEEEGKGTELYKQAYDLLKQEKSINFVGNVEGKTIIDGSLCDVAIADGFTGNIHLKALEGGLKMMISAVQKRIKTGGPLALLGGMILKSCGIFEQLKNHFHPNSFGGALLGGLNGVSIISHGSSNYEAIINASKKAILFVEEDLITKLKAEIEATTKN